MKVDVDVKNYFFFVILPMVVIIIVMLAYSVSYLEKNIVSAQQKLRGLEKVVGIEMIIIDLQQLRGISNIVQPSQSHQNKMAALKESLKEKIGRFREKYAENNRDVSPYREIETLFGDIERLGENPVALTPGERFLLFSDMIDFSLYIMKKIAYHTGLTFDEEAAPFFLTDNETIQIPRFIEYSGKLRGISLGLEGKTAKEAELQNLYNQLDKMQERIDVLKYNINTVVENLENTQELEKAFKAVLEASAAFVDFIHTEVIDKNQTDVDSENIFNISTDYIGQLVEFYDIHKKLLVEILEAKIARERFNQFFLIGGGMTLLLLILYSYLRYYRIHKNQLAVINASNAQLELMSITDPLTGLYNRRYFDKIFSRGLKQIRREKGNMVFIMADIDCFKEYNDTYGHQKGDAALIAVAKTFEAALHRPGDYAFRLGGEEFGVILSDMTEDNALVFAQNLCRNVEAKRMEHRNSSCGSASVTVSMGFMYIDAENRGDENSIYRDVDAALYRAKAFGKNRVEASTRVL